MNTILVTIADEGEHRPDLTHVHHQHAYAGWLFGLLFGFVTGIGEPQNGR